MNRVVPALATLGPVGYPPIAPATAGSAVAALIGWFLPAPPIGLALALIAIGTAIAVWISGEAEKTLGHDAHPIVVDEVAGQSIALLGAPHTPLVFIGAFVLFRIFDVWKPLGARQIQSLPGGLGIVADDVVAGLISCAVLHAALFAFPRLGS